jgi:hypothetical protein
MSDNGGPSQLEHFVQENARLKADLAAARALLPGVYYMDPPDGGQVEMLEQLRRMADDARRYRWLRSCDHDMWGVEHDSGTGNFEFICRDELDAAIDAALAGKDAT